jgi:hypothetical protein
MPITIRTLRDETAYPPEIKAYPALGTRKIVSPESGSFSSNYRIISSRVIIKDAFGNVAKDETYFVEVREAMGNSVECSLLHDGACKGLLPGEYTFSITATLSDGSEHIVVEDIAYTQK